MGMSLSGTQRGNRRRKRLNNEINITPFVDVMLVLLVIFMVTSPMLVSGVISDIPEGVAKPIPGQDESITIEVGRDGKLYIQEQPVADDQLIIKLKAISKQSADQTRIFVRGHKLVDYGAVMRIIDTVSAAGFHKVALVTQPQHDGNNS